MLEGLWRLKSMVPQRDFHSLPSNADTQRIWLVKIRRENLPVNANTRVCSVHFEEESIDVKGGSIPTVFLWSLRPKKRSTRTSERVGVA